MLRIGLPALCCGALVWCSAEAEPPARAALGRPLAEIMVEPATRPAVGDRAEPGDPAHPAEPGLRRTADAEACTDTTAPETLRQHDVRDLVGMGFAIEEIALRVEYEAKAKAGSVTTRVNVLEVLAPEEIQRQVERTLEKKRRTGTCVLRIHPVADLVMEMQEYEELQARLREGTSLRDDASEAPEPAAPFEIDSLVEVIRQTLGEGVVTIAAQGRNLVVRAEPAAQLRIADFLDDLRSD